MAKKPETTAYEVELLSIPASGAKKTMYRNGIQFEVKVAQVLELTDEERQVFEDDKRFAISEATDSPAVEDEGDEASDSQEDSSDGDSEASEEDASSEDSDSEDSSSDEAEEASDEDSSDEESAVEDPEVRIQRLKKDNSRDELNAKAVEAGVEAPETLETKEDVAKAIVEATS